MRGNWLLLLGVFFIAQAHPLYAQEWRQLDHWPETLWVGIDVDQSGTLWLSGTNNRLAYRFAAEDSFHHFQATLEDSLQFRDIVGLGAGRAAVMSAGKGSQSRIFLFDTAQGFRERFRVEEPEGFLDAMAFWDEQHGLAFGDAVNQQIYLLRTTDGGLNWQRIDPQALPEALPAEGGFAASGSCVQALADGRAIIGTQSPQQSRVIEGANFGAGPWQAFNSPFPAGPMAGITSLRFRDDHIFLTGGMLGDTSHQKNLMRWSPGEATVDQWQVAPLAGAYYCLALGQPGHWVVCGPAGVAFSSNGGVSWEKLTAHECWTATFHQEHFYFAGRQGKVFHFRP